MKFVIISTLILFSAFSAKVLLSNNSKFGKNVIGVSSNYPGVQHVDSVAYGYASNQGHTLVNAAVKNTLN